MFLFSSYFFSPDVLRSHFPVICLGFHVPRSLSIYISISAHSRFQSKYRLKKSIRDMSTFYSVQMCIIEFTVVSDWIRGQSRQLVFANLI